MNGLEALERLMSKYNEMCLDTGCNDDEYQNGNNTSERAIIEKELKAFEIIKKYAVNCYDIIYSQDYEHYLFLMKNHHKSWVLKKEEYDLLKEVLQ